MLFQNYLTVPISEFRHFIVRNKEGWEEGDIMHPPVLMNDAESKFKSLQEDKLWVINNPMTAKMLALTTVIGNLTRQLDSKENMKQSNKYFGNSTPSIVDQATTRNTMRQNLENRSQICSENSWKLTVENATEEKFSGVGMKRRTKMTITFQNHLTTHANRKTAEIRNFNSTMT